MAGRVYGRRLARDGVVAMRRKAFRRARELYKWHLGALLLTVALVVLMHGAGFPVGDQARMGSVFSDPLRTLPAALGMLYTPYAFDVLRLYVIFLVLLPFWLPLFDRRPMLALALSAAVYAVPQFISGAAIPDWPGGRVWYFNPLAWQLLFFSGVALGRRGPPGPEGFWRSRWLLPAAAAVVAAGIFVRTAAPALMAASNPAVPFIHDDLVFGKLPLTGKSNLEPVRLLSFAALALLTVRVLPASWSGWRSSWLRPLAHCGRHSLQVYCLGLVLVFIGGTLLWNFGGGDVAMVAATALGIAIQAAAATARERRRLGKASVAAAAAADHSALAAHSR